MVCEPLGHREPVDVRQLDVQQHDLRPELCRGGDRSGAVLGFADDVEVPRLEECPRRSPKPA